MTSKQFPVALTAAQVPSPRWRHYLVAVLIVAVASAIRAQFFTELGRGTPYITYYPCVVLAAYFGGLEAGLLATAISALLCFSWIQQGHMNHIESLAMAVFVVSSIMMAGVAEAMKRAERRASRNSIAAEDANAAKGVLLADLQEAHDRLLDIQFAMDSVGIGVHWIAPDTGRLIYVNRFAAEMLGYSVEEMLALSVPDIDINYRAEDFHKSAATLRLRGHAQFESTQTAKDGRLVPVEVTAYYPGAKPGSKPKFITFIQDISKRKEDERLLIKAKDAADAANRAKSAFLANMSHEIRTPLNAITGMTHLIRRWSGITREQTERLDKIDAAGQHLLEIVNAILDLSKIEAGKFDLEEATVNVGSLLASVSSMLVDKAQAKGLQLLVKAGQFPPNLLGDPARLRQALLNYANNAIKFTESGSVTLRARVEQESSLDALLRFEVQDTGIGIAPDVVPRLFSAFEQGDNSTTRLYGGTGLGLAVTKRLALLMGGDAGLASEPGRGSSFWFTARLKKSYATLEMGAAKLAADAGTALATRWAGKSILVVDDDPMNREVATVLLEDVGLAVDRAEDGEEAVAMAAAKDYALILMDMQMPRLDGLGATRRIRGSANGASIPIVAMTANAFLEDRQKCLAAGMNDFVSKPCDPEALYATLLRWLDGAER